MDRKPMGILLGACLALLGCWALSDLSPAPADTMLTVPVSAIVAGIPADNNGCEFECEGDEFCVATCPVPKGCPNTPGVATAYVSDVNVKEVGKPERTERQLKSVSPCGCVTRCRCCECIDPGEYKGECKDMVCTYRIPKSAKKLEVTPVTLETVAGPVAPPLCRTCPSGVCNVCPVCPLLPRRTAVIVPTVPVVAAPCATCASVAVAVDGSTAIFGRCAAFPVARFVLGIDRRQSRRAGRRGGC